MAVLLFVAVFAQRPVSDVGVLCCCRGVRAGVDARLSVVRYMGVFSGAHTLVHPGTKPGCFFIILEYVPGYSQECILPY